ncbi:MAG TPA: polysaccharide deacetylase family protein [Solirubrobacteraceae bacterium]|jgi:peptidoglycan/xylan/chitin deacetylase (PgdA/CDA1 family)|nr:polysaccharide deacetylase family protein [Solirubrobacteraceae bacterium]
MPVASIRRSLRARGVAALSRLALEPALVLLGRWRGVLVLTHHRVGDPRGLPWDPSVWSASAEQLDRQLGTLARHAEVIDPGALPAAMHAGRGRRVLITFDDGYRDNYELAFPLLRRHGLTAAFFLATGFLDEPRAPWWDEIAWMLDHADPAAPRPSRAALIARYKTLPAGAGERLLEELAATLRSGRCPAAQAAGQWMTWQMARELRDAGMAIGGHTVTHPVLASLSRERQREEIAVCARRLREELGVPMRLFAYPVGSRDSFTSVTQGLLRECGVELAFSYYGGFARPSRWQSLDVPRVHVDAALAPRLLVQRVRALPAR